MDASTCRSSSLWTGDDEDAASPDTLLVGGSGRGIITVVVGTMCHDDGARSPSFDRTSVSQWDHFVIARQWIRVGWTLVSETNSITVVS